MRGKLIDRYLCGKVDRITPAHAGKTEQPAELMREETDHPRTCGENFFVFINEFFPFGSPPHMRGKPFGAAIRSPPLRITPAHAGKTPDNDQKEVGYSDHPRTCGENIGRHHQCCCFNGSPPHMRGKPSALSSIAPSIPDHPRTCGENRAHGFENGPHIRITPAHAGKTRGTA